MYLLGVTAGYGAGEKMSSRLNGEVRFTLRRIEAKRLDTAINQLDGKLVEAGANSLVLIEDALDTTDCIKHLAPDQGVGLVAKSTEEGKQAGSAAVTSKCQFSGGSNNSHLVNRIEAVELGTEFLETGLWVVDAEEAGCTRVELIKVIVNVVDSLLLGIQLDRGDASLTLLALKTERHPPSSGVVVGLDIAARKEARLLDGKLAGLLRNSNDGVANLTDPGTHELINFLARGLAEVSPEVRRLGVLVGIGLEVVGDTLEESLDAKVVGKHANARASLEVTDAVENLVDVKGVTDGNMNRVAGAKTVQLEGGFHALIDELCPNLPVGVDMVDGIPADPRSKTFVEPELVPGIS